MKQVVCINPKRYRLTQGREYTVANNPVRGFYNVQNDSGSTRRYSADLFRDVPTEDTVDQIMTTLSFRREQSMTYLTIVIDGETRNWSTNEILARLSCSCGIHSLTNIVGALMFVESLPNRDNLRVRVLAEFIRYSTTVRAIGAMLISTNTNCRNYEYLPQAIELLRTRGFEITENTMFNPNSDNNIILYTIVVSQEEEDLDELEEEDDVEDIVDVAQLED